MLAVHAIWSADSLHIWAEQVERGTGESAPARGQGKPGIHPFAASLPRLHEALGGIGDGGIRSDLTLLLPTSRGRPGPSPSIRASLRSRTGRSAASKLAPWRVPSLAFRPDHAMDVLLTLANDPPRAGVAVGTSVPALARGVQLSLDMAARGRLLPGIAQDGTGRGVARWLPVPDEDDADRLVRLIRSLPPLCRAEWCPPPDGVAAKSAGALAGRDPGEIIREMAGTIIDHVARSAVRDQRLLRPIRTRRLRPRTTNEAFVAALTAEDSVVAGDAAEIALLAESLSAWHASGIQQLGPVRTTFRLVPPRISDDDGAGVIDDAAAAADAGQTMADPDTDRWRIEFLLQSRDEPSLLVPAERIWRTRGRVAVLTGMVEDPRQHLLTDLGHASRLYPQLERALDGARPASLVTDTAGAHHFLAEAAPLLEGAGFGVLVPPWWRSQRPRLGLRVRARPTSAGASASESQLGLHTLVDYHYEVALGEATLSEAELRRLAELKVPLVRVRGQWVELRTEEIDAALRSLEGGPGGTRATVAELLQQGLGLGPSAAELPVVGITADGWLGELLATDRYREQLAAPAGFDGTLRPYQERGLSWLVFMDRVGLGACLADDMGLGKTIQLLALLLNERQVGGPRNTHAERPRPTLLICPMSVVGNWQREAERFAAGLRVHVHHGGDRSAGLAFARSAKASDLVITTFALAARDAALLKAVRWGRVVVDEAQNIKNAETRQSRAVRALRTTSRIALTGTPVENRLAELWSLMEFCNPGLLGSARAFRERYAVPIERYGDDEAVARLKRIVGPFLLRRLKTDRSIIADLPAKNEMKAYCNLTREQAALYQAVVDDMLARVEASEGIERRGLVLATMMKLKQVCNHPAHLLGDGSRLEGRSGKLARLDGILEEALAEGDRALCFTQFTEMGYLLRDHLESWMGVEVPFLHGAVRKRGRDEMVARFQADDGPPVLLLSLKAGGVGLNLTAANHVIHFDRWWNPAVEDQATDRAFRIGQRRDVQVRKMVCVGTLEERIDRMIEDKRALAERIVGSGEGWLTELSTSQLRDLVALSADAVAEV